jgi:hypothetical protein
MATANRIRFIAALALLAVTVTGCTAANQRFVAFPTQGQAAEKQLADATECQAIADGKQGSAAQEAAIGAVGGTLLGGGFGAATGAILGGLFGGVGYNAGAGAAIGAAFGLISGTAKAIENHQAREASIYRACMAARGYTTGG